MFAMFALAHVVADFVLQPYWLVQRKRRWDGLAIHGGLVLLCMALLVVADRRAAAYWPAMLIITAIHVGIDRWKVQRGDRLFQHPIGPFLLDQVLHIITLAVVLSWWAPASSVWSLAGSPLAGLAVFGAAYVIAACATPIGIMIWLDPSFAQAALAGEARLRSMGVGILVVTATVFAGVAALPMTLFGYALVTRHPSSVHPLDTPRGLLATVFIAATLGALLAGLR